jgi:hypothetical protein
MNKKLSVYPGESKIPRLNYWVEKAVYSDLNKSMLSIHLIGDDDKTKVVITFLTTLFVRVADEGKIFTSSEIGYNLPDQHGKIYIFEDSEFINYSNNYSHRIYDKEFQESKHYVIAVESVIDVISKDNPEITVFKSEEKLGLMSSNVNNTID